MESIAYEIMKDLSEAHWWYRARREIIADLIVKHVPSGSRVIDVGAGDGATAALLQDRGFHVVAADISSSPLECCHQRGLDMIDLRSCPLPARRADCIIL